LWISQRLIEQIDAERDVDHRQNTGDPMVIDVTAPTGI